MRPKTPTIGGRTWALGAAVLLAGCASDPRAFRKPTDVAFTPRGEVYVADGYGNARVARFSPDGRFLGEWGGRGRAPGRFRTPHGVAIDDGGRVYVADRGNARIQVFDLQGHFITAWRGPELGRPWGIAFGPDRCLYVVDGGDQDAERPRGRILKLDRDGHILETWGTYGLGPGQIADGHDIAVGPDGSVYVVDVGGRRVQKFRPR
jgi:DNA-binding beta-propeller fold protein YncE